MNVGELRQMLNGWLDETPVAFWDGSSWTDPQPVEDVAMALIPKKEDWFFIDNIHRRATPDCEEVLVIW